MAQIENVGTFLLSSETIIIIAEWGISSVSILTTSGTVTVTGLVKLGSRTDDAIPVPSANPLNISFNFPIDGLTIDASGGTATLICGR